MPANLTPQYLKAEEAYRRAQTPEEELECLRVMQREIPKHKGTEKLQSEIKQKIARLRKELQQPRAAGKKSGTSFRIPRQGAGTVVLLGAPNTGKSQLLKSLTRATPEVAPYPFTTQMPAPGMMPWEDVFVQIIDTPPITAEYLDPYTQGLIRSADLALLLLDLGNDDGLADCQAVLDRLAATKTRLAREHGLSDEDIGTSMTRTFLVPNKIDLPDAPQRWELFREMLPVDFPVYVISAEQGTGLEELRRAIYQVLDVIRVYTKKPTEKQPDFDRPYTIRRGGTVKEVAEQIHRELAQKLKFARVWGQGVHDGTTVKGDHSLHDKDVVELHFAD